MFRTEGRYRSEFEEVIQLHYSFSRKQFPTSTMTFKSLSSTNFQSMRLVRYLIRCIRQTKDHLGRDDASTEGVKIKSEEYVHYFLKIFRIFSVFSVCLSDDMGIKRDFALSLIDAGMMNDEYVYLFVDPRTRGFGKPSLQFRIYFLSLVTQEDGVIMDVWIDRYGRKDGRDDEAKAAFQRIFILTDVGYTWVSN